MQVLSIEDLCLLKGMCHNLVLKESLVQLRSRIWLLLNWPLLDNDIDHFLQLGKSLINANCVGAFGDIWHSSLGEEGRPLNPSLWLLSSLKIVMTHSLYFHGCFYFENLSKQKTIFQFSKSHSAVSVTYFTLNLSTLRICTHTELTYKGCGCIFYVMFLNQGSNIYSSLLHIIQQKCNSALFLMNHTALGKFSPIIPLHMGAACQVLNIWLFYYHFIR